jgi:hypothetical protein
VRWGFRFSLGWVPHSQKGVVTADWVRQRFLPLLVCDPFAVHDESVSVRMDLFRLKHLSVLSHPPGKGYKQIGRNLATLIGGRQDLAVRRAWRLGGKFECRLIGLFA